MTVKEYYDLHNQDIDMNVDGDIFDCIFSIESIFFEKHGNKEIESVVAHGWYHKIKTKNIEGGNIYGKMDSM